MTLSPYPISGVPSAPDRPTSGVPFTPDRPTSGAPLTPDRPTSGAPLTPDRPTSGAPLTPDRPTSGAPFVPDQAERRSGRHSGRSLGSLLAEHLAEAEHLTEAGRAAPGSPADAVPRTAAPSLAADGWMEAAWDDDERVALAGGAQLTEVDFGNLWKDDDRVGVDDDAAPGRSWRKPWRRHRRAQHAADDPPTPDLPSTADHPSPAEHSPAAADPSVDDSSTLDSPGTDEPSAEEAAALWPRPSAQPAATADGPVTEPSGPGHEQSVADLAGRLGDDLVDASDVVAEIGQLGVGDDDEARRRYGMSLHGLGISVLTHLEQRRAQRGARRAPARRPYLGAAAVRCALYLGPLGVALAGTAILARLNWLVPAVLVLLGWSATQALTSVGAEVARGAGAAPAARLVGGGFLAAGGLWGALVWVAPDALLGGSRMLALTVGLGGLGALATVTAALVTRTEADVVRWSAPCWLLGALGVADAFGAGWASGLPLGTLLPAAIVVAAVRAYRPVIIRRVPGRPRLERGALRRGLGHLVLGAAQAGTVVLLWRAGPSGAALLAVLPLLAAVPALETLIGWHLHEVEAGLDLAESTRDHRRHVRSIAVTTVSALLPPLAAGIALAAAAYRVPVTARPGVLALAAGTLFGGLLAITFLLAARRRIVIAASLAAAAPLAILTSATLKAPLPGEPLPTAVAVLAITHLLGLLLVAYASAGRQK
ncbi:hypothetical protein [Actinoplanes sp. NPDC049265]|uniref:hypothetical protein n=1 Tax=Actinoplanes sp. NPDC049265 TaxID=3363902 RepID=UPI00371F4649